MKNKILIALLFIIAIFLTYSLFHNTENANDISSKYNTISEITQEASNSKVNSTASDEIYNNLDINNTTQSIKSPTPFETNKYYSKNKEKSSTANDSIISNTSSSVKKTITISDFLNNLNCTNYVLKQGETLTQIARKYETTCNLNTSIKLIKSINKLNDGDNLNNGITLAIPESTIKSGEMYPITPGETWYNIVRKYYSTYNADSITKLLVYINDLPNTDLPLGESIFLPSI